MLVIIDNDLIQDVSNPTFTVKYVVDLANRRIRNSAYDQIPQTAVLNLLRLVLNEYMVQANYKLKSYTFPAVVSQEYYVLDVPDLNNVQKIVYGDITQDWFPTLSQFEAYSEDNTTPVFYLRNHSKYFTELVVKPTLSDTENITIYYYGAGTEDLSLTDYIQFPNNLIYVIVDSLIYKLIEDLPLDNSMWNVYKVYKDKHETGLKEFKAWSRGDKTAHGSVPTVLFPTNNNNDIWTVHS